MKYSNKLLKVQPFLKFYAELKKYTIHIYATAPLLKNSKFNMFKCSTVKILKVYTLK